MWVHHLLHNVLCLVYSLGVVSVAIIHQPTNHQVSQPVSSNPLIFVKIKSYLATALISSHFHQSCCSNDNFLTFKKHFSIPL